MREWRARLEEALGNLPVAPERLHDLVEELVQDLEDRARVARSAGADEDEAQRRAWEGLGSLEELRVRLVEVEGWSPGERDARESPLGRPASRTGWAAGLTQDLRLTVRTLLASPGFTLVALLTLGIGIGANTTLFSVVNALFLTPLPVSEPGRLVRVYTSDFSGARYGASSMPDFEDLRDEPGLFASLAAYTFDATALTTTREPARVWTELVSGGYFPTLGLRTALGRPLQPADDREGAPPAVVVSHGLWQRRLGGDPEIVGRRLELSGTSFSVVGVAPEGFTGMTRGLVAEAWVPLAQRTRLVSGGGSAAERGSRFVALVGRLPDGLATDDAQARLDVAAARFGASFPDEWTDEAGRVRRLSLLSGIRARISPEAFGPLAGLSGLLALVVGLLLLIACANVANLMIARALSRRREVAVRLALGASRFRVVRYFLAESLLVVALGGLLGSVLAWWAGHALSAMRIPFPVPVRLDVGLDARVVAFAVGLTLLTGVLLGLVPALQALRPDLAPALKDEGASVVSASHGRRLRRAFVGAQVALSLVLLVGAGLLLRGLERATRLAPGLEMEGLQLVPVDVGLAGYDVAATEDLIARLAERASGLPGADALALTMTLPVELHVARRTTLPEGYVPKPGEENELYFGLVGPGHLEVFGIPLLRGRDFSPADRAETPLVAIVNETFAERYWPGQDPIGKTLRMRSEEAPPIEVVGLAADSTYRNLGEEPMPFLYRPITQDFRFASRFAELFPFHVVVRGSGDPRALARSVSATLAEIDPGLPVYAPKDMLEHLGLAVLPSRVASTTFSAFGLVGLLLASLGVYGVVAFSAAQRTREIGVRVTLGATRRDVARLVLADAVRVLVPGLVVGAGLAVGVAHALRSLLYGLSPLDPVTFVLVPTVLGGVALAASLLPARRAARVDPVVALRCE